MAKILVVDDSSYARLLIKKILESADHEVYQASSGMDALEQLSRYQPDLVTMDLLMPGMEGLELLRNIKQINPSQRVIVITADIQDETRRELIAAGADAFINKPVEPEAFLKVVSDLIGRTP